GPRRHRCRSGAPPPAHAERGKQRDSPPVPSLPCCCMPYGLLIGVLVHGAVVALTLVSPRCPAWLAGLSYRLAAAYNEVPALPALVLVALTLPGLLDPAEAPARPAAALVPLLLVPAGFAVVS